MGDQADTGQAARRQFQVETGGSLFKSLLPEG